MATAEVPSGAELLAIIDKLASYVARNGADFEAMVKQKEANNPRFAFLFGGPHQQYYLNELAAEKADMHAELTMNSQPLLSLPELTTNASNAAGSAGESFSQTSAENSTLHGLAGYSGAPVNPSPPVEVPHRRQSRFDQQSFPSNAGQYQQEPAIGQYSYQYPPSDLDSTNLRGQSQHSSGAGDQWSQHDSFYEDQQAYNEAMSRVSAWSSQEAAEGFNHCDRYDLCSRYCPFIDFLVAESISGILRASEISKSVSGRKLWGKNRTVRQPPACTALPAQSVFVNENRHNSIDSALFRSYLSNDSISVASEPRHQSITSIISHSNNSTGGSRQQPVASSVGNNADFMKKRLPCILSIVLLLPLVGIFFIGYYYYTQSSNLVPFLVPDGEKTAEQDRPVTETSMLESQLQVMMMLIENSSFERNFSVKATADSSNDKQPKSPNKVTNRKLKLLRNSKDVGGSGPTLRLALEKKRDLESTAYADILRQKKEAETQKLDKIVINEASRVLAHHALSSSGLPEIHAGITLSDSSKSQPLRLTLTKAGWLRKLYKSHATSDEASTELKTDEETLVSDPHKIEAIPKNVLIQFDAIDTSGILSELYETEALDAAAIADGKTTRLSGRIVLLPDLLAYISAPGGESLPFPPTINRLLGKVAAPILVDHSAPDALEMQQPTRMSETISEINKTIYPSEAQVDAETSSVDDDKHMWLTMKPKPVDVDLSQQQLETTTLLSSGSAAKVRNSDGRMAIGGTDHNSQLHNQTLPHFSTTVPPRTLATTSSGELFYTTSTKPPPINVCHPIASPVCSYRLVNDRLDRYEQTTLTVVEQRQVFSSLGTDLQPLVKLNQAPCHFIDDLLPLYCALYVPKCGRNGTTLPPCRSFCTRLLHNCEWYMYALNLAPRLYGELGDCSRFPDSDDPNVCVRYIPMAETGCPADHHRCDGGRRCIPVEWMCDRFIDCRDGSDEANCAGCPDNDFMCPDTTCVSSEKVCDGVADCTGGRDEVNCITLSRGIHSDGEGKLQVYDSDTRSWRGVCANNWTSTLSNLTCASLGYKHTFNTLYSQLPTSSTIDMPEQTLSGTALFEVQTSHLSSATSSNYLQTPAASASGSSLVSSLSTPAVSSHRPAFLHWMRKSSTCTRQVELSCATFKCGIAGDRSPVPQFRIIGGEKSQPGKWPFLVSIYVGRAKMFFCGGTIISDRYILTAAHCVFDKAGPAAQLHVRVGDHRRSAYSKFKMEHRVVEVVRHPAFASISNGQYVYDIALLKLAQPISFTDYARPVCLPPHSVADLLPVDTPCTVIGWGIQTERSGQYSNVVNEVVVRIVERHSCRSWYTQRAPNATVGDDAICAGYREGKRDACRGDSGGPLLYFNETMRAWTQAGIVSWGSECARAELPGVYARVSAFTNWVRQVMDDPQDDAVAA